MFDRFRSTDTNPEALIERIEDRLQTAIETRKQAKRSLKQELREAELQRDRAEQQVVASSGQDVEFARDQVEAQEEIIDEYRERIRALNKQITDIRRRFPALRVLRTDVELMSELDADEPVTESGADQIDALLRVVDDMTDDVRAQTGRAMPSILQDADDEEQTDQDEDISSVSNSSG